MAKASPMHGLTVLIAADDAATADRVADVVNDALAGAVRAGLPFRVIAPARAAASIEVTTMRPAAVAELAARALEDEQPNGAVSRTGS